MRGTLVFSGTSCPALTNKICGHLGMVPADAELGQFSNGETSVRILTSVREKDVFVVQSGSPRINDTIMELLIMISACKGGSANKITAVLPYFPYSRQSKKKSHRGAITARMLANLLNVAGVNHVITVDLHASQMQGFFKCPVDNLHAEPLIARWIRCNISNWHEAVVVSKNAGGTKRVTSLADALKLNFGIVTTDRKRVASNMARLAMGHVNGFGPGPVLTNGVTHSQGLVDGDTSLDGTVPMIISPSFTMPVRSNRPSIQTERPVRSNGPTEPSAQAEPAEDLPVAEGDEAQDYADGLAQEVTMGRLVQGHIVPDDYESQAQSEHSGDGAPEVDDPMSMSLASSSFAPASQVHGGSADAEPSSDEEDEKLKDPKLEHMITLVGNVKDRPVLIVDDMIDKAGSWIAAAETVVKRGRANKVYCMATHGVFGGDCLEQLQACECIDQIIVTNSFPIDEQKARMASKLVIIDLSFLLSEAIRRNHYGESISVLFQHDWE